MLEIKDPIPPLTGRRCVSLLVQEYWHEGDLVSAANVLYLCVEPGGWQRVYLDAGTLFWKPGRGPDAWAPADDGEHRHPLVDLSARLGVVGREVAGVETADLPSGGEVRIAFRGGPTLPYRDVRDAPELVVLAPGP